VGEPTPETAEIFGTVLVAQAAAPKAR